MEPHQPQVCPPPGSGARRALCIVSLAGCARSAPVALPLLALVAGCGGLGSSSPLALEIELSEAIPTVATARGSVSDGASAEVLVTFGEPSSAEVRRVTAIPDEGGEFEVILLGMKPNREYSVVASVGSEPDAESSDEVLVSTGGLPGGLPSLIPDGDLWDPERSDAGFLYTSLMPGAPLILDGEGEVVWWHELDVDHMHIVSRLLPTRDGRSLLYLVWTTRQHGGVESDLRMLVRTSHDGAEVDTTPLPMAHHDFVELPDGSVAVIMYDPREIDGLLVAGDRIVEVAPDGSERTVWSVWDHVPWDPELSFEGGEVWGHCNALRFDEDDDAYTLSCRNFSTLYRIDRTTGALLWRIGRTDGDFLLVGDGDATWFQNQHQFRLEGERLLVFDNGIQGGTDTRVAEFALDTGAMEAEQVWSHQPEPPLGVYAYGDVHRLPSGNTLIDWGSAGRLDEVAPDGTIVRRLDVEMGAGFGYMTWAADLEGEP